ncbi:hypothetical protein A2W32_03410 [candidate division WWE3 bacterium RBG_16_37_10]|uniref:Uncharacterized protein n=1 Tax=candidate division WWE3 bacterium RBG_16_37_10 TaxID=1802610 RepID=A0A1F4V1F0_UNCKA|nr:MAG: hypothetical protein A2W32_03410 [candidate division WWE3 bacterium RBG_16_37_10]
MTGRSEFNNLPLNVLLNKVKKEGKVTTHGIALYEPDFSTFLVTENKKQLVYKSIYDPRYELVISYDSYTSLYDYHKYCDREEIGIAFGYDWKVFFIHVGALFLSDGEKCSLEYSYSSE